MQELETSGWWSSSFSAEVAGDQQI